MSKHTMVAGLALTMLAAVPALADTTWTGGGDGASWVDPANWGGTSPDGQRRAFINGTANVIIDASVNHTVNRVILADNADGDDVSVHMTGGALTIAGAADPNQNLEVGSVGKGMFRLSGGTVNVAGRVRLGVDHAPASPEGILIIDGGTMSVADRVYVGFGNGSTARLDVSSGSLSTDRLFLADGVGTNAVLNMTGGTITTRDFWVPTNLDAKQSKGHIQLDGGVINATNFSLTNSQADNIIGTMDITQGMMVLPGDLTADATLLEYISSGALTGYGGAGSVVLTYVDGVGTQVTAVPEPATLALLALGGMSWVRRRRPA